MPSVGRPNCNAAQRPVKPKVSRSPNGPCRRCIANAGVSWNTAQIRPDHPSSVLGSLARVHSHSTPEISATDAAALLAAEPTAILLDVREQWEWDAGHAPQAQHLPMSDLSDRAGQLPRQSQIVCVCHLGGRSAAVSQALNQAGWTTMNLIGGMRAWQAAGLEVIDVAGNPGTAD